MSSTEITNGTINNKTDIKISTKELTETLNDKINKYFSTINPIAEKIALDIEATKSSYEHIWNTLDINDQIDIINETLIKPEIALRYYDNFSSSSSSSASNSSLSLNDDSKNSTVPFNPQKTSTLTSQSKLDVLHYYKFDRKNLMTYHLQKVGLKKIHDDHIGLFRDEHSAPFSYKTKSQINLNIFEDNIKETVNDKNKSISASTILKYKKLNDELTESIKMNKKNSNNLNEHVDLNKSDKINGKYQRFKNDSTDINKIEINFETTDNTKTNGTNGTTSNFLSKFISKNNMFNSTPKPIIISGANDYESEDMVLMNNISYSGSGLTSSTSGEESIDDEEKTVCEDSKLLLVDNNDPLRKGFDFLANW